MKAFLVLLLALNIFVFAAYNYFKPPQQDKDVSQPTSAPALVLAEEQEKIVINESKESVTPRGSAQTAMVIGYCQQIAPIFGMVAVDELVEWLNLKGIKHTVEEKDFEEISNYWVYIPALPSIGQARVILKQLRSDGIDDVYAIEAGPNRNAISLGLYRDKAAADSRVTSLAEQGIEVQIQPRTRKAKGYQLQVGPDSKAGIDGFIEHLNKHYPTLKNQDIACE